MQQNTEPSLFLFIQKKFFNSSAFGFPKKRKLECFVQKKNKKKLEVVFRLFFWFGSSDSFIQEHFLVLSVRLLKTLCECTLGKTIVLRIAKLCKFIRLPLWVMWAKKLCKQKNIQFSSGHHQFGSLQKLPKNV